MAMDIMNKLIAVVLAFILLVIGPIMLKQSSEDLITHRILLNEQQSFLDSIADSGRLTDGMLEDFYIACASTGVIADVDIERGMKIINPDGMGGTRETWLLSDDIYRYNKGDAVTVRVRAIDYSSGQKLSWSLSSIRPNKFDVTLTRRVRK